jgi:hypothetical protein
MGIVAVDDPEPDEPPDSEPDELATVPIRVTVPGVVLLSGSVICAVSPTLTLDCSEASSATWTCRLVEVACATGAPG